MRRRVKGRRLAASRRWRVLSVLVFATAVTIISLVASPNPSRALDVGEPAPVFTLPATTGGDIGLAEFRGKRWVLLEFYGADFAPT
jgi:hypothetical protein